MVRRLSLPMFPPPLQGHRLGAGKTSAPHFCRGSAFILSGVTTDEIAAFARRSEMYRLVKVQFLRNLTL